MVGTIVSADIPNTAFIGFAYPLVVTNQNEVKIEALHPDDHAGAYYFQILITDEPGEFGMNHAIVFPPESTKELIRINVLDGAEQAPEENPPTQITFTDATDSIQAGWVSQVTLEVKDTFQMIFG